MSPYILILVGSESDPTSQRVVDEEGGEYYLRSGSGIGPIYGEVVTSLQSPSLSYPSAYVVRINENSSELQGSTAIPCGPAYIDYTY